MKTLFFCLFFAPIYAQVPVDNWDDEMIEVLDLKHAGVLMTTKPIYDDKWNKLEQPIFWKKIMFLSKDSCLINIAASRKVLLKLTVKEWKKKTKAKQLLFKDSLRKVHKLKPKDTFINLIRFMEACQRE